MRRLTLILLLFVCLGSLGQSVPDTHTFSLGNVVGVVGGSSLTAAFTNAVDAYFDPNYKGNKDRLSNFRNYRPRFYSEAFSNIDYYKQGCEYGAIAYPVSLSYGAYVSLVSQSDADTNADAIAQAQANAYGQCNTGVGNTEQSCSATKNDCPEGYYSPESYNGTVGANSVFAATQEEANAIAQANCASDMQAYANTNGSCVPTACTIGSSYDNQSTCTFTNVSISIDCNGVFYATMDNNGQCQWGAQIDIYNASNVYVGTEYASWNYNGTTWEGSCFMTTPLSNGYNIVIYITE